MSSYHVDLDTRVGHTLDTDELETLLDALHPYGAAISGGLDNRLSVSMTITTTDHGPQDATSALQQALRLLDDQVSIRTVEQAQVSTEAAKDTQLAQDTRALPRMVTVPEIAELLDISRQGARKVLQTDPTAPAAALTTSLGDLYRYSDIRAWARTRGQPRPGRRSRSDLQQEAADRARRTLAIAEEEIRRRSGTNPSEQVDPLTLRICTEDLDQDLVQEIAATSMAINAGSRLHGVVISIVHAPQAGQLARSHQQ